MTTSVLAKEFERLAERNAQLLNTDEGKGDSLAHSKELATEFDDNLTRLEELKDLLEKEKRFDELQTWASTPERRSAAFAPEVPEEYKARAAAARPRPGDELVNSQEFKSWLAHIAPGNQISDSVPVDSPAFQVGLKVKDLITGGSTSGGAFFETDHTGLYAPFIQPQLTLRDLVLVQDTDADLVDFVRAVAHTNAAAEAAEATHGDDAALSIVDDEIVADTTGMGLKPMGDFEWVKVTTSVKPIAEGTAITRRALMNGGQMAGIVNDQLGYDVGQRLNGQMVAGDGSGDNLRGIRNTSGILTQSFSSNLVDTLRKAKTKVSNPATGSGKIPTAALLTPTGLETLDLFRVGGSTTTDGAYLLNPYTDRPQRLWGMYLVEEPAMTANKALVGYFRDAVLWDREKATVRAFEQYKDFPRRNLVFLLAELWAAFGVLQPKSFVDVSTS